MRSFHDTALLGAKTVLMTDLEYALPLMRENVKRNKINFQDQIISCRECDWLNPPELHKLFECKSDDNSLGPYQDIILVADCVWLSSLVSPLLQTLKRYTLNALTTVVITYQQRVSQGDLK